MLSLIAIGVEIGTVGLGTPLVLAAFGSLFSIFDLQGDFSKMRTGRSKGNNLVKEKIFGSNDIAYDTSSILTGALSGKALYKELADKGITVAVSKEARTIVKPKFTEGVLKSKETKKEAVRVVSSAFGKQVVKDYTKKEATKPFGIYYNQVTRDTVYSLTGNQLASDIAGDTAGKVATKGAGKATQTVRNQYANQKTRMELGNEYFQTTIGMSQSINQENNQQFNEIANFVEGLRKEKR